MIPHILIVDDDKTILKIIGKYLKEFGYTFAFANNGKEALDKLEKDRYHILLSDLEMPEMNGKELIDKSNNLYPNMINIIMSVINDVERVVSILNQYKVYDYLIKPFNESVLQNSIDKAFETLMLRIKIASLAKQENSFFRDFVEALDWKNELRKKQTESIAHNLIHQLNIGFFHGEGIGSLLTIVGILLNRGIYNKEKKIYELQENQFNLLKDNYASSLEMVECFKQAQEVLMRNENFREVQKAHEVGGMLNEWKRNLGIFLAIKSQKISIAKLPPALERNYLIFDKKRMKIVIDELLINAMKYSRDLDTIYMIFFHRNDCLEIKILNSAFKDGDDFEITGKNEYVIFEPFYRLNPIKDDRYNKEQFGYGLGLTVVKKIIDLHKANIFINTITNYKDAGRQKDVCVTLRFPLLEKP